MLYYMKEPCMMTRRNFMLKKKLYREGEIGI